MLNKFLNVLALALLGWCSWQCLIMSENQFFDLTEKLHSHGTLIAAIDGILMQTALVLLLMDLRKSCRALAILGGLIFFAPACAANMLDYYTTIIQSPDLSLETSTVWNSVKDLFGLQFALSFGFWGKVFVSLFAAVCFAFYLNNVWSLFPEPNRKHRWRAFCTTLCFYFAGINLFCFYVAYANSLVNDLSSLSKLPPLPAVIAISLLLITVAFCALNRVAYRFNTYIDCPRVPKSPPMGKPRIGAH